MAANDNPEVDGAAGRTASGFAARHPDLAAATPQAFRDAPASRVAFDHARDPLISRQLDDLKKTEAQRREEGGRGSNMVRRDRPSPEHHPGPEFTEAPIRQSFNNAWLKEQRAARLAEYAQARAARSQPQLELGKQRSHGPQR